MTSLFLGVTRGLRENRGDVHQGGSGKLFGHSAVPVMASYETHEALIVKRSVELVGPDPPNPHRSRRRIHTFMTRGRDPSLVRSEGLARPGRLWTIERTIAVDLRTATRLALRGVTRAAALETP